MNGSWIMWVIVLGWVIPFIMRRMSQAGQRGGRPPYQRGQQGRRDQYGRYPGNQYPGQYQENPYPAPHHTQAPPQTQQAPLPPQGQLPEGQSTAPRDPQTPWWQQPLPPGFPGQPVPQDRSGDQSGPQPQPPSQTQPHPAPSGAPDDAPQGYRARKLAELDRQFSEQKISLEEYMKARNEVMRG